MKTLKNPYLRAFETESRDGEVLAALQEAGFTEYAFNPLNRTLDELSGTASNALFLRDLETVKLRIETSRKRHILHHNI